MVLVRMVGKLVWTKEEVRGYDSFKSAIQNIVKSSNRVRVSKSTENNYLDALRQYLRFANSEEALSKTITPDNLVKEAHADSEGTKDKIRLFFLWLQGQEIPGFRPRGKSMKETSAYVRAYAQIRGFYTNNNIIFGKWKTPSLADMKKEAISNDTTVPFFKLDKKRKIFLDRGLLKQFLANLKLRDQAIFLACLSSSQDSGDLFQLTIEDFRKQKDRDRFFWEGQRRKTGVRFKTFFSVEATDLIRRYIEQEREGVKGSEPLFVTSKYKGKERRMNPKHLAYVFRDAAKRMGVELEEGYQNPFRSKRLRHIFRTACSHAHVDEGYITAFMGHKTSQSQQYLEKDVSILELEYSKAEPFLTVYGVGGTEGLEAIQTELADFKSKYIDLEEKVAEQKKIIEGLNEKFEQSVLELKRDFDQRLNDFFAEYEQPSSDIELPPVSKEEVVKAKSVLSKQKEIPSPPVEPKKIELPKEEPKLPLKETTPIPLPKPKVETKTKDCPKCKGKETLNLIKGTKTFRCIECGYMERG